MQFKNEQFKKIWDLAFQYQDKRDDTGHAQVVTEFAQKLVKLVKNADENIVVPAAILHDIGWAKLSEEDRFIIFDSSKNREEIKKIRFRHQDEGVNLAKEILGKVNYPGKLTEKILEIISEHDTREGFISKEEGLMRDADKLWRYSVPGTEADVKRRGMTPGEYLTYREKGIEEPYFFYSKEGKQLAYAELNKRMKEYGIGK